MAYRHEQTEDALRHCRGDEARVEALRDRPRQAEWDREAGQRHGAGAFDVAAEDRDVDLAAHEEEEEDELDRQSCLVRAGARRDCR